MKKILKVNFLLFSLSGIISVTPATVHSQATQCQHDLAPYIENVAQKIQNIIDFLENQIDTLTNKQSKKGLTQHCNEMQTMLEEILNTIILPNQQQLKSISPSSDHYQLLVIFDTTLNMLYTSMTKTHKALSNKALWFTKGGAAAGSQVCLALESTKPNKQYHQKLESLLHSLVGELNNLGYTEIKTLIEIVIDKMQEFHSRPDMDFAEKSRLATIIGKKIKITAII